ncbi:MAG TPA: GNAT family N-acetyltransferase [Gammaproteobacteria bacterium]|nr:GNAT family N-acetyltransferase [Gammaproteobacteria bacterium]
MPNDRTAVGAIELRRARREDAAVLAAAEMETARIPGLLVSLPHELNTDAFTARIEQLAEAGCYLVAEQDGHPVGHGLLEPAPLAARAHVFWLTMVVHPGHTDRGIGKLLLGALLDWAEGDHRVHKVELRVRSGNQRAIGLYRRFGFVEEGRISQHIRLPDGKLVDDIMMAWFPRRLRAAPVILEGEHVRLEPLSFEHLDGLCAVGLDESLWQWVPTPVRTREEMRDYIGIALADQGRGVSLPFATVHKASAQVVGSTRFANMDRGDRRVEIGWTWIGRPWQRTVINTEAKFLMLHHAFETLNCVRVELKTDVLNERSRGAIQRLGATEEGILRKHRYMWTGRFRDTVYYSILDTEWPSVKAGLQAKLSS